jgi:hypothetical protein
LSTITAAQGGGGHGGRRWSPVPDRAELKPNVEIFIAGATRDPDGTLEAKPSHHREGRHPPTHVIKSLKRTRATGCTRVQPGTARRASDRSLAAMARAMKTFRFYSPQAHGTQAALTQEMQTELLRVLKATQSLRIEEKK